MKSLILIQDELVSKLNFGNNDLIMADSTQSQSSKRPEDRLIVLCIAYHNIAVEQEFLK